MASDYVVDFPTLWVVPEWIEQHCPVPDGDDKGKRLELYDWQLWSTANHYRVRPRARRGQKASAFYHRRSIVVGPQKSGKGPWSASIICAEGVGPVRFDGWAEGGEVYDCAEHGCGCGWVYSYDPGEPMGRAWATPLIQLLATAEDQTDNVFRPLQAMVKNGPLSERMRVGEEFIRLPNDGRIDVITSSKLARLGNPITFALQDETGLYTVQNKLVGVAETMRRGLAGMGGRALETTNAWNPTEESVARRTMESKAKDVFRFHRVPPAHLDYADPDQRREIHEDVYAGSLHVDLDDIEAEAAELMEKDPAQAERFFGNRLVAGSGAAFDGDRWAELADATKVITDGSLVVVGVDGARFRDALAIIATDVASGHQWVVDIQERSPDAPENYEHDFEQADREMQNLFGTHQVWRVYVDPQYIEPLLERWQGRWGDKVVIPWFTHRHRPTAFALQAYRAAQSAGDLSNDGDGLFAAHVRNATKRGCNVHDDEGRPMWLIEKPEEARKIDAAMAGCLSWEARGDAIAADAKPKQPSTFFAFS